LTKYELGYFLANFFFYKKHPVTLVSGRDAFLFTGFSFADNRLGGKLQCCFLRKEQPEQMKQKMVVVRRDMTYGP
jgi:hypothetical protein